MVKRTKKQAEPLPLWEFDQNQVSGYHGLIGVDEVGRGCLAGPVVASAVMVSREFFDDAKVRESCESINDSKQVKASEREEMNLLIRSLADRGILKFSIQSASVEEIEKLNIVGATSLAMERCLDDLKARFQFENCSIIVDGRPMKRLPYSHRGVVKGDSQSLLIAMASILAKVFRDQQMREFATQYPQYKLETNKGYGTEAHVSAIKEFGVVIGFHRPRFLLKILPNQTQMELDLGA
jgi:ribonuclease HII